MKYLIFHKHFILDQTITDNIIEAAKRSKITRLATNILLVPDTRFGDKDVFGCREFANGQTVGKGSKERRLPRMWKSHCIPLLNLVPEPLRP